MEKAIKRTNKATLIAAALIITGSTAVFGTYAASNDTVPTNQNCPAFFHQELTEEQKVALEEAKILFQTGDKEAGMVILKEADIKPPMHRKNKSQMKKNLTEEEIAAWTEAKELFRAGDLEGGKAILEEAGIKPPVQHQKRMEFIESLTEEQKEMLKEARELMQAGDVDSAKAIFEELGLERPEKRPGNGLGRKPGQRLHPQANVTE